ncbi:MAG: TonB-dependent receptor [Alphaproteobacteria bacterium]|nr:MAG: TonB-dependent receptor [Alphaproteobacteria bacterium]
MDTIHGRNFRKFLKGSASALILGAALAISAPAFAQDQDDAADDADAELVTITGSRIRRDEFTSAAPIQVFNTEDARQIGVSSIADLLQRSTIASGQQINATLNTNAGNSNASEPPPLGGVGSSNISLRGLGPERTLILINGKRLGSSGVRGAPAQPDLNLIPFALVERIEVITEGASSVYGADAVAGVVNLILRNDFEGMEVSANFEIPFDGGGEVKQFSFITGNQTSNSSFVLAGEFYERKRIAVNQRRECVENIDRDAATGELLPSFCSLGFFDNIIGTLGPNQQPIVPGTSQPLDSIWWFATPGTTDAGIPGFSSALSLPDPSSLGEDCLRTDLRCKGLGPIPYYSGQDDRLLNDLVQPSTQFSVVALATYQPDWFGGGEEFYFESYYLNRHAFVRSGVEQIFPTIQGEIPETEHIFDGSGNIIGQRVLVDASDNPILVDNPLNPFIGDSIPIITLDNLRQDKDIELAHFRFVGGFRGDFSGGMFEEKNWAYDVFMTYDRGVGAVEQPLLSEPQLILATQTTFVDGSGNVRCGIDINDQFGFLTPQTCVPVDFFAANIYAPGPDGDGSTTTGFLSDEEAAFLIGSRVNRTVVEQFIVGFAMTGDLFSTAAGNAGVAIGAEFRRDSISSFADFLSANALNAGENPLAEGATKGSRDIWDIYAEVNVPLVRGKRGMEYLGIEGAIRYTDEEIFGSEVTYRARGTWRPNGWIQISGSYGTSFRAPNLRETFLAQQFQGISSTADPCGVPPPANNSGVYVPSLDTRSATTLANCILNGADPTALGLVANINIPVIISGNAQDLLPETSKTFTAVVQFSPPISDRFTVDFGFSFWDIDLKNAIRSINAAIILSRCFDTEPLLASPFCSRVERILTGNPAFDFVTAVDASFVNVGSEKAQGIDINARFRTTLEMNSGDVAVNWAGALSITTKRTEQIFSTDPVEDILGTFGFAERRLTSTLSLTKGRLEFLWVVRHLSGGRTDDDVRLANDCDVADQDNRRTAGNVVVQVCDAPGAWYHDLSFTYRLDTVVFSLGLRNALDKTPPLVSISAGTNRANRVTSSGYDQIGRTVFFNATAAF